MFHTCRFLAYSIVGFALMGCTAERFDRATQDSSSKIASAQTSDPNVPAPGGGDSVNPPQIGGSDGDGSHPTPVEARAVELLRASQIHVSSNHVLLILPDGSSFLVEK